MRGRRIEGFKLLKSPSWPSSQSWITAKVPFGERAASHLCAAHDDSADCQACHSSSSTRQQAPALQENGHTISWVRGTRDQQVLQPVLERAEPAGAAEKAAGWPSMWRDTRPICQRYEGTYQAF